MEAYLAKAEPITRLLADKATERSRPVLEGAGLWEGELAHGDLLYRSIQDALRKAISDRALKSIHRTFPFVIDVVNMPIADSRGLLVQVHAEIGERASEPIPMLFLGPLPTA